MSWTRFRDLVAIGATVSIAAGVTEIIRRRQQVRSAAVAALVVEKSGTPRQAPDRNAIESTSDRGKSPDLLATESDMGHFKILEILQSHPEASSLPTISRSELSNDGELDQDQDQKTREPSFIGHWITILLIVALICGAAAYHTWQQGFSSNDNPPQAAGGLLMFAAEPLGSHAGASVVVNSYQTGFQGISVLDLTLEFQHASLGTRWFIAASGQYAPRIGMPLAAFCPDVSATRSGGIISCRNNAADGSRDVTYNFKDHIGSLDGQQIKTITGSFDGYVDTNTVILSGRLTRSYQDQSNSTLTTRVVIPIQSPASSQIGSDEYFAYAPIAIYDQGDFGTGAKLGKIATANPAAFFADSFTRVPVNYLPISSLSFSVDVGPSENQLSWASPPTVQADQPQWHTTGQGIGAVRFTLHNPFAADQLSRDSFIAGILVSIAASALLLLLERLIEWWARRRRSRTLNHHRTQSGDTGR